jgi:hypothetical protein
MGHALEGFAELYVDGGGFKVEELVLKQGPSRRGVQGDDGARVARMVLWFYVGSAWVYGKPINP